MTRKDQLKTAVRGLQANRSRSLLTILGIVIGVTAIIIVMSIGRGAEGVVLNQIQGIGSRTIAVIPGREPSGPSDFAQIFSDSLTNRDLEALGRPENVLTLGDIMPVVFGGELAAYGSETYHLTIFGATPLISNIFELNTEMGTFFTDDDVRSSASVAVIGSKVKEELFGLSPTIGERIRMKGHSFRVVGILPDKGQLSLFNFDEMVIVPYTTAQRYIFGVRYFHRFIIEAETEELVPLTVSYIEATLRETHGIDDPTKDDFFVQTSTDLIDRISLITDVLTWLLVSVAAISLLVGGVGIMNIMLVSVTERTREIGLRKAIGATEQNIKNQFLMESIILTGIGGIIGIILGLSISWIISFVISHYLAVDWAFVIPISGVLLGLGVSTFVGLVFGIYPARQAARKDPINALRYE